MGKFNYSNRKSEGVRLGQIVAKDLRKKYIPQRASTNSAAKIGPSVELSSFTTPTSPLLDLNLDSKNLTDEGLKEVAAGLRDVLGANQNVAFVRLQTLNLSGNALSIRSLGELAPAIEATALTIEELEVSNNMFRIENQQDASNWEAFLDSLKRCINMRKLNFNGNQLGALRPMEIFAREHTRQFKLTCKRLGKVYDATTEAYDHNGITIAGISQQLENLTIGSLDAHTKHHLQKDSALEKPKIDERSCGLPSIQCISLQDNQLNDSGALFLSYALTQRSYLQNTFSDTISPRSEDGVLSNSSSLTESRGICFLRNDNLSAYGAKLLKLSETFIDLEIQNNSSFDDEQENYSPIRARKASNASNHSRKTSLCDGQLIARTLIHQQSPSDEIDSLRRKMQRTVLEEAGGISSVDLWKAAITALGYVRHFMINPCQSPATNHFARFSTPFEPYLLEGSGSGSGSLFQYNGAASCTAKIAGGPSDSIDPMLAVTTTTEIPTTPCSVNQNFGRLQDSAYYSSNIPSASPALSKPLGSLYSNPRTICRGKLQFENRKDGLIEDRLVNRLPEKVWNIIIGAIADPLKTLSDRQRQNIIAYGSDRKTLKSEADNLGKPKSVQLWKVLDSMECLSYDDGVL